MKENYLSKSIILFGLSGTFLGFISYLTIIDHDMFHQMALFREVIKTGTFPRTDVFSFTSKLNPVIHHEWGAGAIHYILLVRMGLGASGLIFLKYLLTAVICTGVYFFARRRGAGEHTFAFAAVWGIILGWVGFTTIRAQLYSLLFLVVFLLLIEEDREGKSWPLPILLLIFPLWVNIHAGFLIGLGLYAIYLLELFISHFYREKNLIKVIFLVKYQIAVLAVLSLATLLNPWSYKYIPALWQAIALDRTAIISEWRPVWKVCFTTFNVLLISVIILIYAWHWQNKPFFLLPGIFMLIVSAWQAFWHYRHLSIYAVLFTGYVPVMLENTELNSLLRKFKKPLCLLFLFLGISGLSLAFYNKFWQPQMPTSLKDHEKGKILYALGPVRYLEEIGFSGNIMVSFNDGAYVSWKLYPKVKVSMDSRFEAAYTVDQVVENLNFYRGKEGWEDTLKRQSPDAILVRNYEPIERILGEGSNSDWQKVYFDDTYSLYFRAELAKKYRYRDRRGQITAGSFP